MQKLNIYNASAIIVCVIYMTFAYFSYIRQRKSPSVKKFTAFCIVYSIYCFSIFLLFGFSNDLVSSIGTILLVIGALVPTILCDFLLTEAKARKKEYWLAYIPPFIFLFLSIYNAYANVLIELSYHKFYPPTPGLTYGVPIFFMVLIIYTGYNYRIKYRTIYSLERIKFLRQLFMGIYLFIPATIVDIAFIAVGIGIFPFSLPMLIGYVYQIMHILELEEVNERRTEYVMGLAHELKSPLAPIQMIVSGLGTKFDSDPKTKEALQVINYEVERYKNLVNNLYLMSSIEMDRSGSLKIYREPASLGHVIDDVVTLFQYGAERKGIKLISQSNSDHPNIFFDSDLIKQVLINLVNNSIKYTMPGGKISVDASYNDKRAYVSVSDTGAGIPKKDQNSIFNRFYRAENIEQTGEGGAGLGLSIAKLIIEMHGGEISVESKPDEGSVFKFYLPINGSIVNSK